MHRVARHLCLALLCVTASSQILPFELADVQLAGATFQAKAASSNVIYLLETLDVDRLLWSFRKTAQLATPGEPYRGSWEDPFCELRGHFVGHYLSALAQLVKSSGDARAKSRLDLIVVELGKVQAALGGGYLSAFPSEHFDRLEALKGVWAPYYVIHKIMIGLVDAHLLAGNAQALDMVSAMADYFYARSDKLIQEKGRDYWTRTLETEFGGMNEVMYRLFRITKKDTHLKFAGLFDKPEYWNGLLAGKDVLPYHHANTHLAQVVGFAERYETTSEDDARKAVSTFFDILTANHSFATGGSNWKEFWHSPATLANAILKPENAIETQEICTQYNILKIARALFRWTGDVKYADFYEQALVNGILGVSRLSADEVMDQEEDNLDLLNKLLHKHKKHNHNHDHDHAGAGHDHLVLQGRHVHMDEDLTGHSLTGHTSDMFGAGITWSDSTMQGELNLDAVPETHFHRAGAPGRASMETMKAASKAQEPSWTATPDGDLLTNPYAKGVASGAVAPWQRSASLKWQNYWGYNIKNMDPNDTSNVPGTPGSFLYLLTLGSGMSKRENIHHWGYPLHSFWCCYGTAVESFSKLGDSIYFWVAGTNVENKFAGLGDEEFDVKLPRLYINQYVSSTLAWKDMGLQLSVKSTMYAPGPAMVAAIDLSLLEGTALASKMQDIPFTMLLRMPAWARRSGDAQKAANVSVNGQAWGWQDSDANAPGSYLEITRRFKPGDVILVTIGHSYWINPITDSRPQYKDYAAIMMGPYVMAGLTHDASWLTLPSDDQSAHIHEPPVTPEGLISVQSAANASLYLRVDHYHSYVSTIEDSGDALDATVIIRSGCTKQPGERQEAEVKEGTAAPASGQQLLAAGLRSGHVVMLEAMGQPGFYLGSQGAEGKLVWEQQTRPGASGTPSVKHPGDMGVGAADAASHAAEERLWCDLHSWRVVPGLDGGKDTFSLELVGKKDYYLTGASASGSHKCEDEDADKCSHAARAGLCISEPELWVTRCPLSCMSCKQIPAALYLVHLESTSQDKTAKSWASWHWAPPAAPKYPPGAKVIRGVNRHYLLAPLGNLVDERYTVYFKISMVETHRLTASPEVEADL